MTRTNIYLEDGQTAKLDRMAAEEGISRAELIRRFLDRALNGRTDDLEADLAAIEDSFGAVQDIDVTVRGADDREEHLARMWRAGA